MLADARELAAYQDEPAQLPSGSFGKNAFLRLGFEPRAERTVLSTLHRRAPLIVQQALYWDEEMPGLPCVSIISNAGGILQGDRNAIEIEIAGAKDTLATKQDLSSLATELRGEMVALRAELRSEMAALAAALRTEMAKQGAELRADLRHRSVLSGFGPTGTACEDADEDQDQPAAGTGRTVMANSLLHEDRAMQPPFRYGTEPEEQ